MKPSASDAASSYRIRRASPADHEAVARELGAYLDHIGVRPDPADLDHDIARWREEYDGRSGVLLLVVDPAGEVIGTAGVRLLQPGVGELKRMWIRPARQGLGLGRRLMDACLDEARRLGCRVLRLDTQRRMEAARRLYRSYGFREIPDYNGNPRAQVWMELTL
ncbi:MAG TPA: GNAT family N-acetyltransferase [Methylomirabilota bacterium]|nr:GNAT family N-acetyltransferase [Methylomirabilota bacterium]